MRPEDPPGNHPFNVELFPGGSVYGFFKLNTEEVAEGVLNRLCDEFHMNPGDLDFLAETYAEITGVDGEFMGRLEFDTRVLDYKFYPAKK